MQPVLVTFAGGHDWRMERRADRGRPAARPPAVDRVAALEGWSVRLPEGGGWILHGVTRTSGTLSAPSKRRSWSVRP
jgi:hypothetical protein